MPSVAARSGNSGGSTRCWKWLTKCADDTRAIAWYSPVLPCLPPDTGSACVVIPNCLLFHQPCNMACLAGAGKRRIGRADLIGKQSCSVYRGLTIVGDPLGAPRSLMPPVSSRRRSGSRDDKTGHRSHVAARPPRMLDRDASPIEGIAR